jgi:hypothetical protein
MVTLQALNARRERPLDRRLQQIMNLTLQQLKRRAILVATCVALLVSPPVFASTVDAAPTRALQPVGCPKGGCGGGGGGGGGGSSTSCSKTGPLGAGSARCEVALTVAKGLYVDVFVQSTWNSVWASDKNQPSPAKLTVTGPLPNGRTWTSEYSVVSGDSKQFHMLFAGGKITVKIVSDGDKRAGRYTVGLSTVIAEGYP